MEKPQNFEDMIHLQNTAQKIDIAQNLPQNFRFPQIEEQTLPGEKQPFDRLGLGQFGVCVEHREMLGLVEPLDRAPEAAVNHPGGKLVGNGIKKMAGGIAAEEGHEQKAFRSSILLCEGEGCAVQGGKGAQQFSAHRLRLQYAVDGAMRPVC